LRGNTGQFGGGLYMRYSDAELNGNNITANAATESHGGGLYLERSAAVISGNLFISNTAGLLGGGLHIYRTSAVTLTNNVVADNRAGDSGSGLYVWRSSPRLLHTTVARNAGGDGSGLVVRNDGQPVWTVWLTNTLMVSHSTGISVAAGGVVEVNGILWDSDTVDRVWRSPLGTQVTLRNQHVGDPAFAPDGYHLLPGSRAIDRGVESGVVVDIDGEPRPRGATYDLGADEAGPLLFVSFAHSAPDWVGQPTVFTNTTVASDPVSFTWDFGDGASSTAISPTHTYAAPGSYTVVLTATSGDLQGVATARVVIYGASFTSSSPDWLGQTTVFTNTSHTTEATDYVWAFGDGLTSTLGSPAHVYAEPGVYTVVLTATNSEGSGVATGTVTIHDVPLAGFISSSPDWLGETTVFTHTTVSAGPTDYLWAFGDGVMSTEEHPVHAYAGAGVYPVVLTATNAAGSDVATGTVTVYSAPVVDFTASPTEGVAPLAVAFTAAVTTTPPGDPTLAYLWRFGDTQTSALRDPVHTYTSPGTYTVTLQVGNAAGSDLEIKTAYITAREGSVTFTIHLPLILNQHRPATD
jgi:PKD repeat protein